MQFCKIIFFKKKNEKDLHELMWNNFQVIVLVEKKQSAKQHVQCTLFYLRKKENVQASAHLLKKVQQV